MGEIGSNDGFVLRLLDALGDIGICCLELGRGPYHERHSHLIIDGRPLGGVAVAHKIINLINLFAVVREIDDNAILVLVFLDDTVDDKVVIERGVVIVGNDLTFFLVQDIAVIVGREVLVFLRITDIVIEMLSHQVYDNQLGIGKIGYQG